MIGSNDWRLLLSLSPEMVEDALTPLHMLNLMNESREPTPFGIKIGKVCLSDIRVAVMLNLAWQLWGGSCGCQTCGWTVLQGSFGIVAEIGPGEF